MLEILENPDLREHVAPITIDHYHRMIELGVFAGWNVELLDGVLVEKMSKSELHLYLVDLLFELLRAHCSAAGLWVRKEDPITIGDSEPEPDLSIVAGTRRDFRHRKPTTARLVIEVAVSSLVIDRAKAGSYASAAIPEYWIVRPDAQLTEVYRRPTSGVYTEVAEVDAQAALESEALPGFRFSLAEALAE